MFNKNVVDSLTILSRRLTSDALSIRQIESMHRVQTFTINAEKCKKKVTSHNFEQQKNDREPDSDEDPQQSEHVENVRSHDFYFQFRKTEKVKKKILDS